jgi:DNA integrity scanning protein DisA with diadenylate cyclase activity
MKEKIKSKELKELLIELIMEVVNNESVSLINDYLREGDIDCDNAERQIREIAKEAVESNILKIIKAKEYK